MSDFPAPRFLNRTTPPHIMTLILITGLAAMSLNIFLPSLPSMAAHFGVEYHVMQLTVSLYLAMTAFLQIFIGPISDRFGRRSVLLVSIAIFVVATFGAVLAPNFGVFLACRMLQAAIASGFVLTRAVVRDMVAQDKAASMIGYVTMGMSVVPMIGPVIGGMLDKAFGWQASFALLGIAGVGVLALTWGDLGETATNRAASFRDQARQYPELLKSQRFWGYCLASAFASGSFFAYLGGAPFVGTNVFRMDAATLGFYFGAPALGYLVGNFLSGRYAMRFGINKMALAGTVVNTFGMAILALLAAMGYENAPLFFGLIISVGLGNGIMLPSANAGLLSVRPALAGSASGLGSAFTIGGGAALSALAGAVLTPTSGTMPLILVMLITSAISILCVLWVMQRARAIGLTA